MRTFRVRAGARSPARFFEDALMNPIAFALRRPYTVMVLILGTVLGCVLAVPRMPVDIFPNLNLPVIYVIQAYGGMDPAQMEGLLTNYYEYHFLYISGIHHVESRNIQGAALMKLSFHPGTDMAQAMAETIAYVNRSRSFMPPGTVPPDVVRFDTGSVPVGYLVLSSRARSIGEIQDLALFRVRPIFASLPGVSAPPPFGGNQRTLVVQVDPDRLRSYQLSPDDVVAALKAGNAISPSGTARIKDQMPIVPVNSMVRAARELGSIPLRLGENVYLRDVAQIEDSTDIPTGHTLVNNRRGVFMLVTKRADASTLAVVHAVKAALPLMRAVLPPDIDLRLEFDQSPYVTQSIAGVGQEGVLGALLTGLMVLLFLRDWRSVIVVALNIPIALMAALFALWLSGQTINLMSLGGLALAVGILVDMSTVEVENIHTHLGKAPSVARAARRSNQETAVPRLLAMLCVLAVFLPSFFMEGAARALFMPLSLAIGFAMFAAYLLSSTLVPILAVWLFRPQPGEPAEHGQAGFDRVRALYGQLVRALMPWRWVWTSGYLVGAGLAIVLVGMNLGLEIFPKVATGEFQLRLRAPDGTRIEITRDLADQALRIIRAETQRQTGTDQVAVGLSYCGLHPTSYTINNMYLWMRGPEEAVLRVGLRKNHGLDAEQFQERLRAVLPRRLGAWFQRRLRQEGLPAPQVAQRLRGLRLSFEPADVVNQIMSFGSPTPIEVAVSGPNFADNRAYAQRVFAELSQVPSLRDLQYGQSLDYPAVAVRIDREKAGLSAVTAADVARSLVAATSSSRFVEPIFWSDPDTGIGYYTQVEVPPYRMNSPTEIGTVPLQAPDGEELLVRDVAQVREGTLPGEYDRYNMRRLVTITANIAGEDLGRVIRRLRQALRAAGEPPRGVQVDVRGQVVPLEQMLRGLSVGLILAMVIILLLLTAYFQSWRLALISAAAWPGAIAGTVIVLALTGTTVNLQSFLGAIMAIGVATANAILLLSFAERHRREGMPAAEAAAEGAQGRLRPILMTSFAMLAGMVPMALAWGEGGEQTAPLGRAVIGGLGAATLATLLVVPCVFALAQDRAGAASASLDPDDPESSFFDKDNPA
jgi:multidrug efflux pump subunit AcrB